MTRSNLSRMWHGLGLGMAVLALSGCANLSIASLSTPAVPGAEPVTRAELTRPITAAERRNSRIIVHHDATQNFETYYRVLNPTTEASVQSAALQVCRRIDTRYREARIIRHEPPSGVHAGVKTYFACI